jgi:diguanylate cyclase
MEKIRPPAQAASTATPAAPLSVAELAKATLRRLAVARQEPTPANYARAWREEGGTEPQEPPTGAAKVALETLAARLLPSGDARQQLFSALHEQRWADLSALVESQVPSGAQQAGSWAEVIEQAVRLVERGTKLWPTGRKRESLQHVLSSSRGDVHRLQQRLRQLMNTWAEDSPASSDPAPEPVPETAAEARAQPEVAAELDASKPAAVAPGVTTAEASAPAPDTSAWSQVVQHLQHTVREALPVGDARADEVGSRFVQVTGTVMEATSPQPWLEELDQTCAEVRRVLQLRHHFVSQIGGLVVELTEGMSELAEDDSWVEGQCTAMRDHLELGLSTRGVSAVSDLLRSTRLRQQQLRGERAQARDALKLLIHQMLQDLGTLGEHTGRFSDSVGRYAQVIGEADSLEGLTGIVREMVEETRTVHGLVTQTTERLHAEHAKATEMSERIRSLESELLQLSQEVSTDQLTQIANRRGLLRSFETERSRVERGEMQLAIGLLDIDNFKKLNDTLGHQTGDEALKFLAQRVTAALRPSDTLARYGGEEFVVLLPETPLDEAQRVLTRVQRNLSAELFMYEGKQTFVTFSAGVTLYRQAESIEAALQRADEGLYEAKRSGKNRTCTA